MLINTKVYSDSGRLGRNGIMLKQFFLRNCNSFKEEAIFSMEANYALKDNINFVVKCGSGNNVVYLNPVAAIYGANAGGKTNLLRALNNAVTNVHVGLKLRNRRFYLTDAVDDSFMHRLIIIRDNIEYDYQYTATSTQVLHESFSFRELWEKGVTKEVFDRQGTTISTMFKDDQTEQSVLTATANNTSILVMKTAGEIGFPLFAPFYQWCGSVVSAMNVLGERERQEALDEYASTLNENEESIKKFSTFMSSFDASIGMVHPEIISRKESESTQDKKKARFLVGHFNREEDGDPENAWLFPIELESNGTKKLMELYPSLTKALDNGTPLVCDELDTLLHPIIFRRIVDIFHDKDINKHNAQLIFAAHNTVVMNRECLRRDEITFVDKSNNGKSNVFRLSDVVDDDGNKIRMDARYDRLYIDGILGAVPDGFRNVRV